MINPSYPFGLQYKSDLNAIAQNNGQNFLFVLTVENPSGLISNNTFYTSANEWFYYVPSNVLRSASQNSTVNARINATAYSTNYTVLAAATLHVTFLQVPIGGTCSINPSNGTAKVTNFTVSCANWYDLYGSITSYSYFGKT